MNSHWSSQSTTGWPTSLGRAGGNRYQYFKRRKLRRVGAYAPAGAAYLYDPSRLPGLLSPSPSLSRPLPLPAPPSFPLSLLVPICRFGRRLLFLAPDVPLHAMLPSGYHARFQRTAPAPWEAFLPRYARRQRPPEQDRHLGGIPDLFLVLLGLPPRPLRQPWSAPTTPSALSRPSSRTTRSTTPPYLTVSGEGRGGGFKVERLISRTSLFLLLDGPSRGVSYVEPGGTQAIPSADSSRRRQTRDSTRRRPAAVDTAPQLLRRNRIPPESCRYPD